MTRSFSKTMFVALGAAVLATGGCESAGGDISVLSSSPIAAGSTYAWNPAGAPKELTTVRRIDNDMVREEITTSVDANLATKGFRLVEPAQAQYLLAYDVHVLSSPAYESWLVRNVDHVETKMMLDMTDTSTGRLVWRATSQKRVNRYDEAQEGLNAIFSDMVNALAPDSPAEAPAPPRRGARAIADSW